MEITCQPHSSGNAISTTFTTRKDEYRERVNTILKRQIRKGCEPNETLSRAVEYAVLSGGKRLRPLFSYATAEAAQVSLDVADVIGAAVELIHAYSLVHDDLPAMDDDDLRRGRPTVHIEFDEATAILVGDSLNTMAFELLADPSAANIDPRLRCKLIHRLAIAAGARGMAGGQGLDMAYTGQLIEKNALESMFTRKTGKLIAASIMMTADCGSNLSTSQYAALERYANLAGLCFQIHDDILDVTQSADVLGKSPGSDVRNDRSAYPARFGLLKARERAAELLGEAQSCLEKIGPGAEGLTWLTDYIVTRNH
ncbi:polyprenyl synthetase family protein [bacterium]|nr:polyprenyl synthetase family protein [bacterium]